MAEWPRIVDGLLTLLPTVWGGVTLLDGPTTGRQYTSPYATVGWSEHETAGEYRREQSDDGVRVRESGSVGLQLIVESGQVDASSLMRYTAFGLADMLDDLVRADRTLGGLLAPDSTCSSSVTVVPVLNVQGSACVLDITIDYLTITGP